MHKTIYCTEPECGSAAVWTYDGDKACCGDHELTVKHHMEAMGRVGPYVDNPLIFCPIPNAPAPPQVDWPLLANRYKQEAESLRQTVAELHSKLEFADGELSVSQTRVRHLEDEIAQLKLILDQG